MNKQRKVLITITYNEMGVIIDTKPEELGSSAQLEPCEDAVSRNVAIDAIISFFKLTDYNESAYAVRTVLGDLPPVTPKQRTGKWLINCDGYYPYCSECGTEPESGFMTNFCPNCGAKMEGDAE